MIVRKNIELAKLNYTDKNPSFAGRLKLGIVKDGVIVCIVRAFAWCCATKHLINITFTCSSLKGITVSLDMRTGKTFSLFQNKNFVDDMTFVFLQSLKTKYNEKRI